MTNSNVFCLLDGLEMACKACPRVFSHLTDPTEVELCRSCEHHPEEGFLQGEVESADVAEQQLETKQESKKNKLQRGSINQAIFALAKASGASKSSVRAFYSAFKNGRSLPNGPMAKAVATTLDSFKLSWDDIARGVLVTGTCAQEQTLSLPGKPVPEKEGAALKGIKITGVCLLSRDEQCPEPISKDAYLPQRSQKHQAVIDALFADDYESPTYGGGQNPAAETLVPQIHATQPIEVSEMYLREPTFEEVLVSMKRRLPIGAKITIEL